MTITYNANGTHGTAKNLLVFVDTARGVDTVYDSDITISGITFSDSEAEPDTPVDPDPDTPVDPEPDTPADPEPEAPALPAGQELTFTAEDGTGYEIIPGENGAVTIKYNGLGNTYKPICSDVSGIANDHTTLTVYVHNNGSADSRVRFDMQATNWIATGDASGTDACNVTATGGDIWTDLTWGGSTLTVPAGETVQVILTYNPAGEHGAVKNLLVYIDSARGDGETYNSNVTLGGIEFSGTVSLPEPEPETYTVSFDLQGHGDAIDAQTVNEGDKATEPAAPTADGYEFGGWYTDSACTAAYDFDTAVTADITLYAKWTETEQPDPQPEPLPAGQELTFTAEGGSGYEIIPGENGSVNVKYNGAGTGWKPICADIAAIANTHTTLTVHIRNNGETDSRVRFDVQGTNTVGNTDACNVSATGGDIWTDTEWGGSTLTVPAGQTVEVVITYDPTTDKGAVKNLLVYVDTARGVEDVFSSDITIGGISFSGEVASEPETPDPIVPSITDLNFWVSDAGVYTATNNGDGTYRITYNGVGNTYTCAGADVASHANSKNTLTLTVTNNGVADSRVRFDVQATTQVGETNACNVSATGGDIWTDTTWGGSALTVPAGETITVVITYDPSSERGAVTNLVVFTDSARGDGETYHADITLSGISFSTAN